MANKKKTDGINSALAALLSGTASAIAVAPMATISDIKGSVGQSTASEFYGKSYPELTKMIFKNGFNNPGKLSTKLITKLPKAEKTLRAISGMGRFFKGQGMKTLKLAPQNAINLALFTVLSKKLSNE